MSAAASASRSRWSVAVIITGGRENKTPVCLLGRLVAVV
jgi:hypothetical protein